MSMEATGKQKNRWRVSCHYRPYGVSNDGFVTDEAMLAFVTERVKKMEPCIIQINRMKRGAKA